MSGTKGGGNKPGGPVSVGRPSSTTLIHRNPGKVTGGVSSPGMIQIPVPSKTGGGGSGSGGGSK